MKDLLFDRVETIVAKGEIAYYEHFIETNARATCLQPKHSTITASLYRSLIFIYLFFGFILPSPFRMNYLASILLIWVILPVLYRHI